MMRKKSQPFGETDLIVIGRLHLVHQNPETCPPSLTDRSNPSSFPPVCLSVNQQTGGKVSQRMKKRPPRGMFLSQQDVVSLASSSAQGLIRQLDCQLVSIKKQVCRPNRQVLIKRSTTCCFTHVFVSFFQNQTIKQTNSSLKEELGSGVDEFKQPEVTMVTSLVPPPLVRLSSDVCLCWTCVKSFSVLLLYR